MSDTRTYEVPPVTRALALLRHIAAGNRCRNVSKTSAALGINRTTLTGSRDIVRLSRPLLARLAQRTGLSAQLGVLSGTDIIVLVREAPDAHLVSNIREGARLPAHANVMGRMILSHMPREAVRALLQDHEMPAITAQTPQTVDDLFAQFDRDRAEGLAWSVAFFEEGIGSCSAAVRDHSGGALAAISVSGPQAAFEEGSEKRDLIATEVRDTAAKLSA